MCYNRSVLFFMEKIFGGRIMVLFQSMTAVMVATIASVAILITFGTGRQPLVPAWMFLKSLVSSRNYLLFFIAMLTILLLNKNELKLEQWMNIQYDLTGLLSGWEGAWPATLQSALQSNWLTAICAVFYVVLFQSAMIASVGIYTSTNNMKLYYAFCIALLVNYFVAVPFYLFVPVFEVWHVQPAVRFLLPDVFPTFEEVYRPLSGIDNCFPSLHTSLSVTVALLASRSGIRRWAIFTWINASVIIFSIFYLGIHWFTDMVAGLVLAVLAATVGLKVGAWAEQNISDVNMPAMIKAKLKPTRSLDS